MLAIHNAFRSKFPHYFKLQLFCHDQVSTEDTNIYTLYLCTITGKGEKFIPGGKNVTNKKMRWIYNLLLKPWIMLDLAVYGENTEDGTPVFFITDTELRL